MNPDIAKYMASALLVGCAFAANQVELLNRGKGSWYTDRLLLRIQGALVAAALVVLFL